MSDHESPRYLEGESERIALYRELVEVCAVRCLFAWRLHELVEDFRYLGAPRTGGFPGPGGNAMNPEG